MSFIKKTKIISILLILNSIYFNNLNSATTILSQASPVQSTGQVQFNTLPNMGQFPYNVQSNANPILLQTGVNTQYPIYSIGNYTNGSNQSYNNNVPYNSTTLPASYTNNSYTYNNAVPLAANTSNNLNTTQYSLNNNALYNSNNLIYGVTNLQATSTSGRIYNKPKTKSCQNAYAKADSCMLDLSDTYDINTNGSIVVESFIKNAKEKNHNFVYIDLCNTEVQPYLVNNWNQLLKQNNIQVTWNLSNNSIIDDNLFTYYLRDLSNIKGLNISNTNISSAGILYLSNLLQNNIDSTIQYINICGLNIDLYTQSILTNAFEQHKATWVQKNNKEYITYNNGIIYSYNDNVNTAYNLQYTVPTVNQQSGYQQYNIPIQTQQTNLQQGQLLYNSNYLGNAQSIIPITNTNTAQHLGYSFNNTLGQYNNINQLTYPNSTTITQFPNKQGISSTQYLAPTTYNVIRY